MADYVGAIDQGTTSTRFIVFDHSGAVVAADQREHEQIHPRPGWVEHDAEEIWTRTQEVVAGALEKGGLERGALAAVGITNQRETAVLWERDTGRPVHNAIVWQDTRTGELCRALEGDAGPDRFREVTGLPIATYFSGPKIRWILDAVDGLVDRARNGEILFGNVDSFLIWHLTGGPDGGLHVTDPTNASRTLLMNLRTLEWEDEIIEALDIPRAVLPEIRSSSEVYGEATGVLEGIPLAGDLGDQQAAMFGQACYDVGDAKNTYGTGNFLLVNVGEDPVASPTLLATVAFKVGDSAPVYALEGSIAVTGAAVQWLRDNLGLIDSAPEVEELARTVDDNGGAYLVPAFSGLFAPHWRADARGVLAGLTAYVNKGHIARAVLEATAFQSREVVDAVDADADVPLTDLKVDGGMVGNELLMQFQADILGVSVIRPTVAETTALGAAHAAGLAVGFWEGFDDLRRNWGEDKRWDPQMDEDAREETYRQWKKAVERTLGWAD